MQTANSPAVVPTTIADQAVIIGRGYRRSAANALDTSHYHLLTPLLLTSGNVEQMLYRLMAYSAVISSAAVFRMQREDGLLGIEIVEDRPEKSPAAFDLMRFYVCEMATRISSDTSLLARLDFNSQGQDVNEPLWSALSANVRYAGGANVIWFNGEIAGKPDRDRRVEWRPIEAFVLAYLKGFHQPSNVTAKVRASLEQADHCHEELSLECMAAQLYMSRRSLQRHLKHAETSLRNELHHSRCLKGNRLLTASGCSATHIAQELGCSDAAHFSHSFKKWTGLTPSAYRQLITRRHVSA